MAKRVAVIDIGSNSVRMVIYEKTSRFAFHLLHEEKSKVRISENAYKHDGNLQELPMQRTFDALRDFVTISESFKVRKLLCVATSALRDAPNRKDFLKKVRDSLKLNIKIIDGQKEAYFGAMACANLLPDLSSALSIDIGGGSTELTQINDKNISNTISLNIGTVRLKELYFDKDNISGAIQHIDKELELLKNIDLSTLVGIGGTFRAISSAIMKEDAYPLNKIHAYEYSRDRFKKFISDLLDAEEDELKKLGIKSNRFDVIKPGALILSRVIKKIDIENITTSGVGVREGVYLSDLLRGSKDKFPHNYNTSVKYILDTHVGDKIFSNHLNLISKKLFDLTKDYLGIDEKYRYELALAAKLYPAGSSVHFYSQNKHTYYLIQSALEYGFSHKSITLIATLTKYAKSRLPASSHLKKYSALLPKEDTTNALSFLLSLSIALLSHRPRNIDFDMKFVDGVLHIESSNSMYLSQDAVIKLDCNKKFKVRF
ncbi:MAG: phosphatase [Spirochaetaceae bacterium 4572_7]|nr:MAG: phosphatase [Spirochaetaceae bacterium 4572_7]